jgi:hypothetical protein
MTVSTAPAGETLSCAPPEAYATEGMAHLDRLDDEARFPLIG